MPWNARTLRWAFLWVLMRWCAVPATSNRIILDTVGSSQVKMVKTCQDDWYYQTICCQSLVDHHLSIYIHIYIYTYINIDKYQVLSMTWTKYYNKLQSFTENVSHLGIVALNGPFPWCAAVLVWPRLSRQTTEEKGEAWECALTLHQQCLDEGQGRGWTACKGLDCRSE